MKKNYKNLRSYRWFAPNDIRSFGHRSRAMQIGYSKDDWYGKPIIGRLDHNPSIYLATMHSGISLGPLVGSLVARELVQDIKIPILEDYRPSRFD